jgi:Xaa-Pro dipeptidase
MLLNRSRATHYMAACGIDALVGTSPVNVRYLSDFHCWLAPQFREYMVAPGGSSRLIQQNFALLPLAGDPALVVEPYFAVDAVETWVDDVRIAGGGDFEDLGDTGGDQLAALTRLIRGGGPRSSAQALAQAVIARGLQDSRIGVELDGLSEVVVRELRALLPRAELLDCSNLLRVVRAVKSPDELTRLRAAASAAERAAQEAFAAARIGEPFIELEAIYRRHLGAAGADFDHFTFAPRGTGIASGGAYAPAAGDVIYADWGCAYRGYCSDTGTTLAFGGLDVQFERWFQATVASVTAGAQIARPGVRGSEVQAAMRAVIEQEGVTGSYPHGHGFGLEARDYPILVPPNGRTIRDDCIEVSADVPLERGMVFNLEAPIFVLGRGAVHTEQSFVVTDAGCELLIEQDRQAPVSAGTQAMADR